ncbi:MAG: protein kinase [Akkermansiaceae bacterium]|nr:protein kinase [Akkermansiaceae bacterium]
MEAPTPSNQFEAPSVDYLQPLFPTYEIEDFIAQGGMGAVYKARQISLDRPVAIKILPREFGEDPAFRASFEAEAKAMARLNHPNLIGVYDFGEVDGMLFLVMEFVQGKSLYHSSYGKSIDPTQAAEIVIAICRGLDHAHSSGILHRDVKPANILLSPDATPKIGDFGLASPLNATASADDIIYGTPGYTAPEVIHRQPVDRRADVFSTGIMLHELLTGSLPDGSRTPASSICGCALAFDRIIARSTHTDPQLRYATTGELADDLEKALKSTPAVTRLNLTPAAGLPKPVASHVVVTPRKATSSTVVTLTVLGIVTLGVLAFFLTQNKDNSSTQTPTAQTPPLPTPQPEPEPSPVPVPEIQPEHTDTTPEIKPPPRKTSPQEALAQLKGKLAAGARDEFPEGTIEHNGSHYLYLKQPMTWHDALRFAEQHGGHLAIAPSAENRKWLLDTLAIKESIWLGAGIAAREQWQWLDDSKWNGRDQIKATSKEHRYLSLTPEGGLASAKPDQSLAYVLQWRNDGTNPCTLEAQLKRASESVKKEGVHNARYPVGTRSYQKSHFLLIPQSSTWENAHQLAKSYRAQLAVPSSPVENQWLATTFSAKSSYWLGGFLLKPTDPWQWTTREPWHSSGWKPGEPKSDPSYNRLLMTASDQPQSWVTSRGSKGEADATLIEWSHPKPAATVVTFDLDKWLDSVNRKIKDRVEPDVRAYDKDRKALIDKYVRAMKRAAKKYEVPNFPGRGGRGGRGDRANYIVNLVNETMDEVEKTGELPDEIPERAPEVFHEVHEETEKSLDKLDTDYQAKLKAHLEFYTQGLLKKAAELAQTGYYPAANTIKDSVEKIGDDSKKFISLLGL